MNSFWSTQCLVNLDVAICKLVNRNFSETLFLRTESVDWHMPTMFYYIRLKCKINENHGSCHRRLWSSHCCEKYYFSKWNRRNIDPLPWTHSTEVIDKTTTHFWMFMLVCGSGTFLGEGKRNKYLKVHWLCLSLVSIYVKSFW